MADIWNPVAEKDVIIHRSKVERWFLVYRDTNTGTLIKSEPFLDLGAAVLASKKILYKQKIQIRIVKRMVYVI